MSSRHHTQISSRQTKWRNNAESVKSLSCLFSFIQEFDKHTYNLRNKHTYKVDHDRNGDDDDDDVDDADDDVDDDADDVDDDANDDDVDDDDDVEVKDPSIVQTNRSLFEV